MVAAVLLITADSAPAAASSSIAAQSCERCRLMILTPGWKIATYEAPARRPPHGPYIMGQARVCLFQRYVAPATWPKNASIRYRGCVSPKTEMSEGVVRFPD